MDTAPTRRAVLRLGGAALVTGLGGCSGPLGGTGSDRRTATLTPVPLPTVDADTIRIPPVGAIAGVGPLELVVTDVVRSARTTVLGTETGLVDDDEFLAVGSAPRNRGDRYLAVEVDRYDVAHGTGVVGPIEPFAGLASSGFAGLAFARDEPKRVRLHYKILPGTADARLRGAVRVRSLPDDAVAVATVEVDPAATAAESASLEGSLSAPVHGVGDRVEASGLAVAVHAVEYPVELSNWMPPPGFEHLAVNLSVENDTGPPGRVVVGLGRFGGMTLVDPAGAEFVEDRRFDGTLAGGAYHEDSTAVLPGGTNDGTAVVAVPIDATPLRLFWTPPAALWRAGSGVAVNRYVWRPH